MKLKMAGNTNVGCVRTNNEDNFCASSDLSSGIFCNAENPWGSEQVIDLGPKGVLLVVADGMGGTNAGEVASLRAVTRVAEFFAPERITPEVTARTETIRAFMEQAISACDKAVKTWGDTHPESKGMGTTMVLGWILGGKLYVAWCGDSRAYVYHLSVSGKGDVDGKIYQVSKDHSYVQLLVDKELLTREEMFDHPQGNIITRSLSHGQPDAKPESLPEPYTLCNGDIVLLCSDGLCGMLRDEEMAKIIGSTPGDLEDITNALINGARDAGGSDNITAVLCQVEDGGAGTEKSSAKFFAKTEAALNGPGKPDVPPKPMPLFDEKGDNNPTSPISGPNHNASPSLTKKIMPTLIVLALLLVGAGIFFFTHKRSAETDGNNLIAVAEETQDTTPPDNAPTTTEDNRGGDNPDNNPENNPDADYVSDAPTDPANPAGNNIVTVVNVTGGQTTVSLSTDQNTAEEQSNQPSGNNITNILDQKKDSLAKQEAKISEILKDIKDNVQVELSDDQVWSIEKWEFAGGSSKNKNKNIVISIRTDIDANGNISKEQKTSAESKFRTQLEPIVNAGYTLIYEYLDKNGEPTLEENSDGSDE